MGRYDKHVLSALQAVEVSPRKAICVVRGHLTTLSRSTTAAAEDSSSKGLIESRPAEMSDLVLGLHVPLNKPPNP